ncbi:hypothetical protein LMG27177_06862 [Paraburkholderia fynbosensis]|uniref:Uncharacterized protein n=1 Tax=Paraburkholderia fynbosensis TaxID=1200993 RepID=A0A6J5GZS4_9BURK|nr:hypothetical protein LMG27177_06862 [Paraburkholderia fynbosensis]
MYLEHIYTGFEPLDAFHVVSGGYFEHRLLRSSHAVMRHERLAVDDVRLETGSYDFSVVAQGNLPRDGLCIGSSLAAPMRPATTPH